VLKTHNRLCISKFCHCRVSRAYRQLAVEEKKIGGS